MADFDPDYISSDCPLGGAHIAQGIDKNHDKQPEKSHPISLLRKAYGI
jgi:Fe-S oxidoreductase